MSDRNLVILAGVTSVSLTAFSRCSTLFSTVSAESTARALSLSTRTSSGYPLIVAMSILGLVRNSETISLLTMSSVMNSPGAKEFACLESHWSFHELIFAT